MMMKAEARMKQLQAPKYQELKAITRSQEEARKILPYRFQKKNGSADTLIADLWTS